MPLTTGTVLTYSMGVIGALLLLLISLVVYVFLTLRQEVRGVSTEVSELRKSRVKLIHVDDFRLTNERIHQRIDECEFGLHALGERLARAEAFIEHERGGHQ